MVKTFIFEKFPAFDMREEINHIRKHDTLFFMIIQY